MAGIKIIAKNKRATYDYFIEELYEAGLVLQGTEVKSLRTGKVTITEAHISIDKDGQAWAHNLKIAHYEFGNINNHQEDRKRKLLLNKIEIEEIAHRAQSERLTIIPIKIYFKGSRVKLQIALAKGKKLYDKRQSQAKKDADFI